MNRTPRSLPLALFLLGSTLAHAGGPDEREWIQLFDGKSLDGWTPKIAGYEAGVNFGETFRVENGVLKVSYDKYNRFENQFGHLFYEVPFSYYVYFEKSDPATCRYR